MSNQPQRDWLDDALKENARYISDNGFTASIVAALPVRQQRDWVRSVILGIAAVAGCVAGLVLFPGGKFVTDCVLQLVHAKALQPALIMPALVVAGLVGAAFIPVATEK